MEEVCLICLILLIIDFKRQKEFSIISKIISNIFKFENSHTLQLHNVMYHIDSGFLDNLINIFWGSTRITHFSLILKSLLKSFFLNNFVLLSIFFYLSLLSKWDFQQKQMQATITSKKWYCSLHLVMQQFYF